MALRFDAAAVALVATERTHHPADTALTVSIRRRAAPGGAIETITMSWTAQRKAEHHLGLVRMPPVAYLPVYLQRRLWRYLQWHDVTVTTCRWLWNEHLVLENEFELLYDLHQWEFTHPDLARHEAQSAGAAGYTALPQEDKTEAWGTTRH